MGRTNPTAEYSCPSSMDSSGSHHPPPTTSDHDPFSGASSSSSSSPLMLYGHGGAADHHASTVVRRYLSTDLRLGLSISPPYNYHYPSSSAHSNQTQLWRRELQTSVESWPPIKALLRSTLAVAGKAEEDRRCASLFVKVYMEGVPIGRKLDLFAFDNYNDLVAALGPMFRTTVFCADGDCVHSEKRHCDHVLTYEDKEGDWMMVGDVPWEMFLSAVKRLKITRSDRC